jgi:hypothetical protein
MPPPVIRFPADQGQIADIIVTVNGDASPFITGSGATNQEWTLEARALNFPYRKLAVYRIEPQPSLPGLTVTIDQSARAKVTLQLNEQDPPTGSLRVLVRDLSACDARHLAVSDCLDFSAERSSVDVAQTFSWRTHPLETTPLAETGSPLLGAGIGRFADIAAELPASSSVGVKLRRLATVMQTSMSSSSSGVGFAMAADLGEWSHSGYFGEYPGYGYSGLVAGNRYGGYYNGQGSGYGAPDFQAFHFDARAWTSGITSNSYLHDASEGGYGIDPMSFTSIERPLRIYGSSAFYRGYGLRPTLGSSYSYVRMTPVSPPAEERGKRKGVLAPAGSSPSTGAQPWLAH